MSVRRVWFDKNDPTNMLAMLPHNAWLNVNLVHVAACAMQEMLQVQVGTSNLTGLLGDFLVPGVPELRWRGTGLGVGTEMRRGMSNLFGRMFARWFLTEHLGASFFSQIDRSPHRVGRNGRILVERTGTDLPDWIVANSGSIFLGESKGSRTAAINTIENAFPLRSAKIQLNNANVFVQLNQRWIPCRPTGWAILSRWATESDTLRPLLFVEDPPTSGFPEDLMPGLVDDVRADHYRALLLGMGFPRLSERFDNSGGAPVEKATIDDNALLITLDEQSGRHGEEFVSVLVDARGMFGPTLDDILPFREFWRSHRRQVVIGVSLNSFRPTSEVEREGPIHSVARADGGDFPFVVSLPDGFVVAPLSAAENLRPLREEDFRS
jgi:hypothetical protein